MKLLQNHPTDCMLLVLCRWDASKQTYSSLVLCIVVAPVVAATPSSDLALAGISPSEAWESMPPPSSLKPLGSTKKLLPTIMVSSGAFIRIVKKSSFTALIKEATQFVALLGLQVESPVKT